MSSSAASRSLAGHRYVWQPGAVPDAPVLLLLHGTGGDETSLLPLAPMIAPGAAILSPRGNVLEQGMPRFFKRLAEGVFDLEDLRVRTAELARFIDAAAAEHSLDRSRVYAVGYSNGANVATSLMLTQPAAFAGAVLYRAMMPFQPEGAVPSLLGVGALLLSGRADPIVPADQVERLAAMLRDAGAEVRLDWLPGGHQLGSADVSRTREWLDSRLEK